MTTTQFTEETKEIVEHIERMEVKKCVDTHTHNKDEIEFDGYVILGRGERQHVCPLFAGTYFCLNLLYIKDGKVFLSRQSVGGNVLARDKSLETAIKEYSEMASNADEIYQTLQVLEYKIWKKKK